MITRLKNILASLNDNDWGRTDRPQNNDSRAGKDNSEGERGNPPPRRPGYGANPELEELWKNINQRLGNLFGKKGGGNGDSGGDGGGSMFDGFKINPWLLVAVPIVLWLASGFFIVQEAQRAVVLTFGAVTDTVGPGFRWRAPWPIQSTEIVNVSQIRSIPIGYQGNIKNKVDSESLMLTNDENIVDIQATVQYRLKSAEEYLFNNIATDETIKFVAETALREVIGRFKMDFVLYEGREQVAADATKLMQEILDRYKTGVILSGVILQNAQPPEQVQAAFDDAVKAGQDRERQKNEGESYANDVIPKARGLASRMLEEAQGYSAKVVGTAQGDAERFNQVLVEYQRAPGVTRSRMYLESMQEVYNNVTKIMIEAKNTSPLLYLPLDKIVKERSEGIPVASSAEAQLQQLQQQLQTTPQTPELPVRNADRVRETR